MTEQADTVDIEDACPKCGEQEIDKLWWIDDDQVECDTCGTIYTPQAKGVRG